MQYLWFVILILVYAYFLISVFVDIYSVIMRFKPKDWLCKISGSTYIFILFNLISVFIVSFIYWIYTILSEV